jgi:hypothetical protein
MIPLGVSSRTFHKAHVHRLFRKLSAMVESMDCCWETIRSLEGVQ